LGQDAEQTTPDFIDSIQELPWRELLKELELEDFVKRHIVEMLKIFKNWLPDLFKGIGNVKIGRTADNFVAALGPIFTVLAIVYDFYKASEKERRAIEAAERKARQLDEAADGLVSNIQRALLKQINSIISDIFAPLTKQIERKVEKLFNAHESAKRSLESLNKIEAYVRKLSAE
jgi:hypothetical protein